MYRITADGWIICILYRYKHKIAKRWYFGSDSRAQRLASVNRAWTGWTQADGQFYRVRGGGDCTIHPSIPPGGSTCTPTSYKLHLLMRRLAPASALSSPLFTRLRAAVFPLLAVSYASSRALCFFCACTHLHLHTRKTSHPSKNILALLFYLFLPVCVMGLALSLQYKVCS